MSHKLISKIGKCRALLHSLVWNCGGQCSFASTCNGEKGVKLYQALDKFYLENPFCLFEEIEYALFHEDLICRMTKKQTHIRSPRSIYLPNARHTPHRDTHISSCIGTLVNWPVLIKVGFWRYFLSGNSERLRLFFVSCGRLAGPLAGSPSQIWLHCVEWFDRKGRWHRKCCFQIGRILQKEWKTHAATFSSLASAWTSP